MFVTCLADSHKLGAHSVSPLSLFDGANMLSTIFNFQIYFIKLHEKLLKALIYAGTFFIFRVFTQGAEGQNTPNTNKHCTFRAVKMSEDDGAREKYTEQSRPKEGRSTVPTYTRTHTMHTRVSAHERGRIRGGGGESTAHQVAHVPRFSPSDTTHAHGFHTTPTREMVDGHTLAVDYTRAPTRWFIRAHARAHTHAVIPPPSRKRRFRAADARARMIPHPPRHTVIDTPTYASHHPSTRVFHSPDNAR